MRRWLGAALALTVLAGCAAGPDERGATGSAGAADTTTAAAAPPCEQLTGVTATGPEILPPLRLACLGPGPEVALDQLTGRPTLVNLWATWCLPCREEMPLLQDAFERYGEQVRFLGVDTQDAPDAAASFVTDLQIGYPQAVDPEGALLSELGVRGLPVTLGLDSDGRVVARVVGQLDAEELQQLMDSLLRQ